MLQNKKDGYQPKAPAQKPTPPKTGSKIASGNTKDVLYICDRRKCKKCSYPECKHTTDISHAKNFRVIQRGIYYEEREKQNE